MIVINGKVLEKMGEGKKKDSPIGSGNNGHGKVAEDRGINVKNKEAVPGTRWSRATSAKGPGTSRLSQGQVKSRTTSSDMPREAVVRQRRINSGYTRLWRATAIDKKRLALKQGTNRTSLYRLGVQLLFVVLSIIICWQFVIFVNAAKMPGNEALPMRPPGVEGYLPISGLMGLLDWINQGALNNIHPAATMLFIAFVLISILVRKGFCGWVCPVGFLSEGLARIGQFIFGRNFRIHIAVDIPLRSLKYFLLGFFVFVIFFAMSPQELHEFITSPYNKISDIKMMEFFPNMTVVGWSVLGILAGASILVHSFWCRYLCPYGALMGIISIFSPTKVHRDKNACIDCGICDKVCPSRLPVSKKDRIISVECTGCTDCVASCPVPKALGFGLKKSWFNIKHIAITIVLVFTVVVSIARITGNWSNNLSDEEIRNHVSRMHSDEYGHPGR